MRPQFCRDRGRRMWTGGGLVPVLVRVQSVCITKPQRIGWRGGQAQGPLVRSTLPPVPTDEERRFERLLDSVVKHHWEAETFITGSGRKNSFIVSPVHRSRACPAAARRLPRSGTVPPRY